MSKHLVIISATLAVIVPIFAHIRNVSWGDSSLLIGIFPIFGLLAFALLWLHVISGVFEEWLRKKFEFDSFVHWTALVILASIILHPLLLLIFVRFDVVSLFSHSPFAVSLGFSGLILLLTYDIGKILKRYEFFTKNWSAILIISTIGFILTFFHSLMLGSDLQSGFMRMLWIFYGVTAIIATIYTYVIKRFLK